MLDEADVHSAYFTLGFEILVTFGHGSIGRALEFRRKTKTGQVIHHVSPFVFSTLPL